MAPFSFGAGNARKILSIPLYAFGRLATAVIPRTQDLWVFGCAVGIADGALALWRQAAADRVKAVWLVASDAEAREAEAYGIPHARKTGLRGFWLTARARVVVVTHGFGDVNRYGVTGAFIVQLWHGIPLKRIGLDSPETVRSGILPGSGLIRAFLRGAYARTTARIRFLPAASHLIRGRLESAFGLPSTRVHVTGEPRVDVLSQGTPAGRSALAREGIERATGPLPVGARTVLYAPTWRDGAPDPAIPSAQEWRTILAVLEHRNAVLLVRSHPLGAGEYQPPVPSDRVRGLGSARVADVTPLLPGVDVLVTDYSSLAFDAGLVPLPVLYFAPDLEEYRARRGMYGRYADVAGDDAAVSWATVCEQLDAVLADPAERTARSFALSERVHAYRDGRNTERVYEAIRAALRGSRGVA
ncbi:CDP-glycerol glycerophosphotransferase family protein [Microbacterium sp. RD1]|uniref:CDP-glycerol glycerophosphotransferase family protein n=1 Tax=Microbacterium sp. RD1 TaxID=3457313 RepID=UPI003FA58BD3